jgi:peptidyl-prolyl cis-trans isomerase D
MLAGFRAFAKSWAAKVLLGVLALAFVIWGGAGAGQMRAGSSSDVVRAGHHTVGAKDYKRIVAGALQSLSQQQGRSVSVQEAIQADFDQDLLRQLGEATSLWEVVRRLGVRPSDRLVGQQIAKIQAFINPATGKFDKTLYENLLRQNGFDTKADQNKFVEQLGDEFAEAQFNAGLLAGLVPPKTYGAVMASQIVQQRDAEYFTIAPSAIGAPPQPTDAQLSDMMKQMGPQLQRPETRLISLVRLSQAAFAPAMSVDQAAVQKAYEQRKATLSTPEKRAFVQINLRSPADASVLSARLARGEDPAAAAQAIGAQAITFPDSEKPAIPDPAVANAVFSLQAGQTSGPIKGQAGLAIVRVTRVTPGKTKTLDEARGDIEQELRQEAARQKVFDMARKYTDARESGADLAKAAAAAGATLYTIGPVNAQGQNQKTGQPTPSLTPQMLKDAFSKASGSETDLVDIGGGEYYALRVDQVIPSSMPPLAEIRQPLAQLWMQQEMQKRMVARGEQLIAQVKAGKSLEAVAASSGSTVQRVSNLTRLTAAQQQTSLGRDMLMSIFSRKPGELFTAGGPGGLMVARISAVRPGNPGNIAALAQMTNGQAVQGMSAEMRQFVLSAAQHRIKPKIDRNKGLTALGVDPASVAAASAPAAGTVGGRQPTAR